MAVEIWQPVAAATKMNYSEFVYATYSFCPVDRHLVTTDTTGSSLQNRGPNPNLS